MEAKVKERGRVEELTESTGLGSYEWSEEKLKDSKKAQMRFSDKS